jgi:hypothetical protein
MGITFVLIVNCRRSAAKRKDARPIGITVMRYRVAGLLLLAATVSAAAAPNIPPSELPGRDRQRFLEQPLDRFTQPQPKSQPLWQWECEEPKGKRKKKPTKGRKNC